MAAKSSAFPKEALGRVRAQLWSRLHNKFKVAKYDQLPAAAFPEAVEYLVGLSVRGAFPEALPEAEAPKALPVARTRNDLGDYKSLYRSLPPTPQYWMDLLSRYLHAHEILSGELEAIKADATKPFRVNRKSGVSTYFDEAMSPAYRMFDNAEKSLHLAYCQVFDAMEGFRSIWLLLHKG